VSVTSSCGWTPEFRAYFEAAFVDGCEDAARLERLDVAAQEAAERARSREIAARCCVLCGAKLIEPLVNVRPIV
jgi:hypothetical protein